jgi:hypothetical protein
MAFENGDPRNWNLRPNCSEPQSKIESICRKTDVSVKPDRRLAAKSLQAAFNGAQATHNPLEKSI